MPGNVDWGGGWLDVPGDENRFLSGLWISHMHTRGGKCVQIGYQSFDMFHVIRLWMETFSRVHVQDTIAGDEWTLPGIMYS